MLYISIKFVHVIAAMVLLGLPLGFTRFKRTLNGLEEPHLDRGLMNLCGLFPYLYVSWVILLVTGLYMSHVLKISHTFLGVVMLAMILVGGNLWLMKKTLRQAQAEHAFEIAMKKFTLFSIVHHSLVTGLTATMVFRTFWF